MHERPTPEDVHAFGAVAEMLLPYLRKTCWPNEAAFPAVLHSWPSVAALQRQYVGLVRLLRVAAHRFRRGAQIAGWFELKGYKVTPVVAFRSVLLFVQALIRQRPALADLMAGFDVPRAVARALVARMAGGISAFLGIGIRGWCQNDRGRVEG